MAKSLAKFAGKITIFGTALYYAVDSGAFGTTEKTIDIYQNLLKNTPPLIRENTREDIINFLALVGRLKRTVRTGWVKRGVPNPENVSDHMYRMGIMSMLANNKISIDGVEHTIDTSKLVKMALVHDLAEALVGDITPHCGIKAEDKFKLENDAMKDMLSNLDSSFSDRSDEILHLWNEYNDRKTPEAILCKDFDKFEMILQAYEYEVELKKKKSLQEFFDSTKDSFSSELVREWVKQLYLKRDE